MPPPDKPKNPPQPDRWKNPPNDIMVELTPDSPLSERQERLYDEIRALHKRFSRDTSLRVYVLGCERPPKVPGKKK